MGANRKRFEGKLGALAFSLGERSMIRKGPLQAERVGARLGMVAWIVDRKHRRRTLSNLEMALPDLSEAERLVLAKEVFRHFGRTAADFMRADVRTAEEVLSSVEIVGKEHLEAARAMEKGVLAITGHFGNWERYSQWMVLQGVPLSVVARDADDTEITVRMLRKREAQGVKVITRGDSVKEILRGLRSDRMIGILADQNSNEAYVPFFGKQTGTVLGPAVLHIRSGAPLLPTYCARIAPGRYRIMIRPILPIRGPDATPTEIMAALHAELEAVVREFPSQWLWMHDRWKAARRAGLL